MLGHDVYLQSGQLPSESASVKEITQSSKFSSPKPVIKSELTQNKDGAVKQRPSRGRPRKFLASPRPCTGDDVVADLKLELPQNIGSAVSQRPSRRRKILAASLPRTSDKIDGDVDHEDVQLVVPFEIPEPVKRLSDVWERKFLRNSGG